MRTVCRTIVLVPGVEGWVSARFGTRSKNLRDLIVASRMCLVTVVYRDCFYRFID